MVSKNHVNTNASWITNCTGAQAQMQRSRSKVALKQLSKLRIKKYASSYSSLFASLWWPLSDAFNAATKFFHEEKGQMQKAH